MTDSQDKKRDKWQKPLVRLFFSILIAYPLSGMIYAIVSAVGAHLEGWHPDIFAELLIIVFWTLMTPASAGVIPETDFNQYMNMYPWIIPIAAALFFLWSKGWRWFI